MLERMWSKGNTSALLLGVQTGTISLEISMAISQKVRNHCISRPRNTTLRHIPKGCSIIPQGHLLNHVYSNIIRNVQTWKQSQCSSTEEWIRIHLHNRILLSGKKKWHLELVRKMDGTRKTPY